LPQAQHKATSPTRKPLPATKRKKQIKMENKTKTLAEVLDLIKEKRYQLNFDLDVPDEYKGNTEVIRCILENGNLDFEELPDTAKNDKQLLTLIAKEKSYEFENFPVWAKDDKDIVLAAISESCDAFKHTSERLRGEREVVIAAFTAQSSYDTIKYVASEELQNDIEILKLAVKGHNDAFGHIPENWRTNKELIELVLAGEVSSSSFEHFPIEYRDNEEIAKKVVGDDAGCFRYLSERLRNNKELAIIAVSGAWYALGEMPDAMLDDKDVVLSAVQNQEVGGHIMNISDRLKSDIDIVIAAVSKDNRALEYFPDEFKDNEKVIESCLNGHGSAYKYFSERFRNDRKIALEMSAKWNFDLGAAPEIFKNDREILKNAIKGDANNFKYVGSELLKDFAFLKELFMLNEGVLSHMDDNLKTQLFTTQVQSVEYRGKKIIYEMVIDAGYAQRSVKSSSVRQGEIELVRCDNFPVLTYEADGPLGSYLRVRYLNNILLVGDFTFFIKENSGEETWENSLSRRNHWHGSGPELQTNDDFLKHEVYLIPQSAKTIDYENLSKFPRLYFGRPKNLPKGIQLIPTEESYREALTILKQENTYGEPKYKKINDNTLEAIPGNTDEVFGAARVYVDGFGWRFLIPHKDGALKALDVLKSTTDKDDIDWIKSQSGDLNEYQINLLKEHFGDLYK
jgi:hypothetical protein